MFEMTRTRWLSASLVLVSLIASAQLTAASEVAPTLIRSDYAAGEVTTLCNAAVESTRAKLDQIAAIAPEARTVDNTLLAYEETIAGLGDASSPLIFMGYVATDEALRTEGSDCEQQIGQFAVDINTRKDLYDALKDAAPRSDDEQRLLAETIKAFEANGLKLPADRLAEVKELKQRLTVLESKFATHNNEDKTTVELTEDELAGLPADYRAGLRPTEDGTRFIVGTRSSDSSSFMSNATNSEARRKWLLAYYNRGGAANSKLLEDAILLRQSIAKLMGYETWADYRTNGRMAQNSKTVLEFLNGLRDKLAQRNRQDMDALLKFKKELDPSATRINNWDINYLSYQLKKRDYSLDQEKVREYFPADQVMAGMFEVYSTLFGVKYAEVQGAKVWSPDVKLYRIEDTSSGELIGYFYADMVPRQGKYGHAAAFPLLSARLLPDGSYSKPVASIVANLTPPTDGKPSLLLHSDVVTLFHEFGHIMHQTLTRARYASLAGSSVAQDFVEAPSQVLENWVWSPEVLGKISGHYLDRTQKLPAEMLGKMIAARNFNQGYAYSRQLLFGLLDMTYHTTTGAVDSSGVYNRLFGEMFGVESIPGGNFPASFGHLMGGYDAGYYGYLWSEVYAADMFTRFESEGLLCPTVGGDYRRLILGQGNMRNALDLLRDFLGREPNSNAFFRKLGIGNSVTR